MGVLKFTNKGVGEIYLTRYYNSESVYNSEKDDLHFNDDQNPFSDYCFQLTCGNWQNDKIKILTLPTLGKLFYQTNPGASIANYAAVTIGQMITVRDMVDFRILKFSAEGEYDGQFLGNYLTEFTIERFCGTTSNNIITTVKLNMVDIQQGLIYSYERNIPQICRWQTRYSPDNYTTKCTGQIDFTVGGIINIANGFFRLILEDFGFITVQKSSDNSVLQLNDILDLTTPLKAILDAPGMPDPNAYPNGNPSNEYKTYKFEYSPDGMNAWEEFQISFYSN